MSRRNLPSLSGEAWLHEPRLQAVLSVLNGAGETRVAGGAVRNSLLGVPVADVDLATTLLPKDVMAVARKAGFGVHPTGLNHGTVTVTHQGAGFEVTTLRRDVETDGRRAVVSFTHDWAEDAARRDFTMNALYCDVSGKIYDFTDGYSDILKRKVRFVGVASQRIREDYLRIPRFFRFHAFYGKGAPDADALKACVRLKAGIKKLSAERVRQELLKILVAPQASKTLKLMADLNILKSVLPYTDEWRVLGRLPADAVLRLFVLAKNPAALKDALKLSNADAARLQKLIASPELSPALLPAERRRMIYQLGREGWRDAVGLSWARSRAKPDDAAWHSLMAETEKGPAPVFPLKGADLISAGIQPGPQLGNIMALLEDWWVANDFVPQRKELLARLGRYKT